MARRTGSELDVKPISRYVPSRRCVRRIARSICAGVAVAALPAARWIARRRMLLRWSSLLVRIARAGRRTAIEEIQQAAGTTP